MKFGRAFRVSFILAAVVICCGQTYGTTSRTFGRVPIYFESNATPAAQFLARGGGYALSLAPTNATIGLRSGNHMAQVEMQLDGANASAAACGMERLEGTANYFFGQNPAGWRASIPLYARVNFGDVYPGIDVTYYGREGELEYDFVVHAGSNPTVIALSFVGVDSALLDSSGDLKLRVANGELILRKPVAYQEIDGRQTAVACNYKVSGKRVAFELGDYDAGRALIIDPVIVYSTYLGGRDLDSASSIAVDGSGNVYVTGYTLSSNFPTARPIRGTIAGSDDVFVVKLGPNGTNLIYATYLGGTGTDLGRGIAVDRNGIAYITGETDSPDFPIRNAFQTGLAGDSDSFLIKLGAAGTNILYSSYLGGNDYESGNGIAVNNNGIAYVCGETFSGQDFPKKNPFQANSGGFLDMFVARFETTVTGAGSVDWSSWAGGADDERATCITLDSTTNIIVAGEVLSSDFATADFPTRNALQPAFGGGGSDGVVLKINSVTPASPTVVFATYLGGESDETINCIALDAADHIFVAGVTTSANFPVFNAAQGSIASPYGATSDAFITRIHKNGGSLLYSTFLGGQVIDEALGIAVDDFGDVYLTGWTTSFDFPVTPGADQPNYGGGGGDAFVTKLNPSGSGSNSLIYSTFLGGSGLEYGYAIDRDASGSFYVAGETTSTNFIISAATFQRANGGGYSDAFVTKFASPPDLGVTLASSAAEAPPGSNFTYTVGVYNNGRTSFSGVALTNSLSPLARFLSVTTTRGSCSQAGGVVTCQLGTMTNDAQATVTIVVQADANGTATTTTRLTANEPEVNLANNTDVNVVIIKGSTDISIAQTNSPIRALYGSDVVHTFTVRNRGAVSPATQITLSYDLPPSGGSIAFVPSQGSCALNGLTLLCDLGALDPGATATVWVTNRPANLGTFTNTVNVSAFEIDPLPANNTSTTTFSVVPSADLAVSHTGPIGSVIASNLTYTVTVSNKGPFAAQSAAISEPFAPSFAFVQAGSSQGTCSAAGGVVTCSLGALNAGAAATATIVLRPVASGTLTLTASADSATDDPIPANNAASVTTTVQPSADIAVRLTAAPATLSVTSNLVYTIALTNNGPQTAQNVAFADALPSGVTFLRFSTNTANCTVQARTVTCNVGALTPGAGTRVTLTVKTTQDGSLANTVDAFSDLPDPVSSNNTATTTVTVTPAADLLITQVVWPAPITEDNRSLVTVRVTNAGPSTASGVWFTNRLPSGVTFLSFTAVNATCTTNGTGLVLSCNVGTLTNGESASATIRARFNTVGTFTNNVSVRGTTPVDLNLVNNTNAALIRVFTEPSVAILRQDDKVVLGWPTNRGALRLWSTPDLNLDFLRVTNASSSFLDYNVLTQQISGPAMFYRVQR